MGLWLGYGAMGVMGIWGLLGIIGGYGVMGLLWGLHTEDFFSYHSILKLDSTEIQTK